MNGSELLQALCVAFAFLLQALLTFNFTARNWKPEIEGTYGWIIYALGVPSLILGILMLVDNQRWFFVVPSFLYSVWAREEVNQYTWQSRALKILAGLGV